jgi:hypothetical protein
MLYLLSVGIVLTWPSCWFVIEPVHEVRCFGTGVSRRELRATCVARCRDSIEARTSYFMRHTLCLAESAEEEALVDCRS